MPSLDCSLNSIYARDSGICWICQQPVWKDSKHPIYRPSRDHVIPRKDGGRSTLENLKLAHQGCNSDRHATPRRARVVRQWGEPVLFQGRLVVFRDGYPHPVQFEISVGNDDQLVERLLDAA